MTKPSLHLSDIGEFGFIERMLKLVRCKAPEVRVGPGDDAFVCEEEEGRLLIVTTDMMVENTHFRLDWQTAEELGHKALASNISDIASMGGSPRWAFVSMGCSPETEVSFLEALYQGMLHLAEKSGILIAGGDTTRSESLILSLTLLGFCNQENLVTISGASVGEKIYATGCPGMAALGLRVLEKMGRESGGKNYPRAVAAHLVPEGPWLQAPLISRHFRPGAMTDLSDGLARDVGKICSASGVGGRLNFEKFPWDSEMLQAQREWGWDPIAFALSGGEDYSLIFTAKQDSLDQARQNNPVLKNLQLIELGEVIPAGDGLVVCQADTSEQRIDPSGFDHFKGKTESPHNERD
mgnify:CR=1 FL=1